MKKTVQIRTTCSYIFPLMVLFLGLVMWPGLARAQWTDNGPSLTTMDNIGIGTTSPLNYPGVTGIEISSTDPVIRLNDSNGTLDKSNYEMRAIGAPGYEGLQFRKINNANSLFTTLLFLDAGGNIGIGTTAPTARLHLRGDSSVGLKFEDGDGKRFNIGSGIWTNNHFSIVDDIAGAERFTIDTNGNIGIGTTNPSTRLHVNGGIALGGAFPATSGSLRLDTNGDIYWRNAANNGNISVLGKHGTTDAIYLGSDIGSADTYIRSGGTIGLTVKSSGNIGIGTTSPASKLHVEGDVMVSGNIAAKYQDLAEWVPAAFKIPAGTVVVLDTANINQVLPSENPYDTRVAGVISEMPGILLGEAGAGRVKVATTGRVKVKADATKGAIQVGDLLVTSHQQGVAMRSEPLDLGGVPIHRPGTLIGKALEPLNEGEGTILVLLSLQ